MALSSGKMAAAPSWKRWERDPSGGMASGRAGRSSPGPPSSRWSGGLATIGYRVSRGPAGLCAALRVRTGPRGTWPSSARGWGLCPRGRAGPWAPLPLPPGGPGREVRPGGHSQTRWDRVARGLGGGRAACRGGWEKRCPLREPGRPSSLPMACRPSGQPALLKVVRGCSLAQEAFVDCSRREINTRLSL